MSQPKIKAITTHAGVCQATGSRTLRTPDIVRRHAGNRVLSAIKLMGYTPNKLRASLRQGESFNIVASTSDITNPCYSPIGLAIEKLAMNQGCSLRLGDTMENPKIEQTCANTVSGRQADGIIICSEHLPFNIDESGPHSFANFPPIVSAAGIAASKNSINTESQCTIDLIESTQPTKLSH